MQFGGFYFLSRKWASDEQYLTDKIRFVELPGEVAKLSFFSCIGSDQLDKSFKLMIRYKLLFSV